MISLTVLITLHGTEYTYHTGGDRINKADLQYYENECVHHTTLLTSFEIESVNKCQSLKYRDNKDLIELPDLKAELNWVNGNIRKGPKRMVFARDPVFVVAGSRSYYLLKTVLSIGRVLHSRQPGRRHERTQAFAKEDGCYK